MPSERVQRQVDFLLDEAEAASPAQDWQTMLARPQAVLDEILVSGLLKALTESSGEFTFGTGRQVELKGISGAQTVHPIERRRPHTMSSSGAP